MKVGEDIVFVGATAPHRADCQTAVAFIMDYLKTDAPFWKAEKLRNKDSVEWVEQKQSDIDQKKKYVL